MQASPQACSRQTSSTTASLEWVWIALSAAWWLASGWLLVARRARWLGGLTVVLGAFAAFGAAITLVGDDGLGLVLASPKLPLAWLWAFVAGVRLVVDPGLDRDTR